MMTVAAGVFIFTLFISKFGQTGVAAFGIATRIEQMVLIPTIGLNIAILTLTGQNNGAGKLDRVKAAWHKSLWYGFIMMLFGTAIVLIFARPLIVLYSRRGRHRSGDTIFTDISPCLLRVRGTFYHRGVTSGFKKPMYAIWIGVFRQIVAPVPVFWLLSVALQWELLGI